jgi:hypothetical protein
MDLAQWRQAAEARMEDAMADLDHRLVQGEDIESAQHHVVDGFMVWTRRSVHRFVDGPLVASQPKSVEMRHWERVADRAVADHAPEQLERFLRIWLAVIHEAAALGCASLYALSSG